MFQSFTNTLRAEYFENLISYTKKDFYIILLQDSNWRNV